MQTHPTLTEIHVRACLASVQAVPRSVLPDGPARKALLALAHAGLAEAYASGGELTGTWCLWSDTLARLRPDRNGRVAIASEWCQQWEVLSSLITACAPAPEGGES